jgi:hypothetical protein
MTIPYLTTQEFIDVFKKHGWDVVSDKYWDEYNRVILGKDDKTFVLKVNEDHFYPIVVKTCRMLGMTAPESCQKPYDQRQVYLKHQAEQERVSKKETSVDSEKKKED